MIGMFEFVRNFWRGADGIVEAAEAAHRRRKPYLDELRTKAKLYPPPTQVHVLTDDKGGQFE